MSHKQEGEVCILGGGVSLGTDTPTTVVVDQLHCLGNLKLVSFGIGGALPSSFSVILTWIDKSVKAIFILWAERATRVQVQIHTVMTSIYHMWGRHGKGSSQVHATCTKLQHVALMTPYHSNVYTMNPKIQFPPISLIYSLGQEIWLIIMYSGYFVLSP